MVYLCIYIHVTIIIIIMRPPVRDKRAWEELEGGEKLEEVI